MAIIGMTISFIAGAAVGSGITIAVLQNKFEKKAQREISEARKAFHRLLKKERENEPKKYNETSVNVEHEKVNDSKENDKKVYAKIISECGYDSSNENDDSPEPYEISEADFEESSFRKVTLMWISNDEPGSASAFDDILCDEKNGVIYNDDIKKLIGDEGCDLIYEDESPKIYIRNERFSIDISLRIEHEKTYDELFPGHDEG